MLLLTLIVLAVLYILSFPLGALLCRYKPIKLTVIVNIILGIMEVIFIFVSEDGIYRYGEVFLSFIIAYLYVPNLILYFKMRSKCKRNGVGKEKYTFKRNAGMAAILTACHFPIFFYYDFFGNFHKLLRRVIYAVFTYLKAGNA